jgi:hypothetical protein
LVPWIRGLFFRLKSWFAKSRVHISVEFFLKKVVTEEKKCKFPRTRGILFTNFSLNRVGVPDLLPHIPGIFWILE